MHRNHKDIPVGNYKEQGDVRYPNGLKESNSKYGNTQTDYEGGVNYGGTLVKRAKENSETYAKAQDNYESAVGSYENAQDFGNANTCIKDKESVNVKESGNTEDYRIYGRSNPSYQDKQNYVKPIPEYREDAKIDYDKRTKYSDPELDYDKVRPSYVDAQDNYGAGQITYESGEINYPSAQCKYTSPQIHFGDTQHNYRVAQVNYDPEQLNYESEQVNYDPRQVDYNSAQIKYESAQDSYNPTQVNYDPAHVNYGPSKLNYKSAQVSYDPALIIYEKSQSSYSSALPSYSSSQTSYATTQSTSNTNCGRVSYNSNPSSYNNTHSTYVSSSTFSTSPPKYNSSTAPTYNETWHVWDKSNYGLDVQQNGPKSQSPCCEWWKKPEHQTSMRCSNGSRYQTGAMTSYGVYQGTRLQNTEGSDDFATTGEKNSRGVVVNATGNSALVRTSEEQQNSERNICGWCFPKPRTSTTTENESCLLSWCKPTILLLILVLLIVVFMLISGILLYFNCTFSR